MKHRCYIALLALASPSQLAAGQDLLVTSRFTDQVLRYDSQDGTYLGVFAEDGGLDNPVGLTFGPDGDLYVASANTNSILVYDGATGSFLRELPTDPALSSPRNLNFGPDGNLYVASGNRIVRYAPDGRFLGVFAEGGGISGTTSFTFGLGGDLLICSVLNNRVLRFDARSGSFRGIFATAHLSGPHDIGFGPDGLVYVSNAFGAEKVVRFDRSGAFIDVFLGGPAINTPLGIAWTRGGSLLVASQGNDTVRRYDARSGAFLGPLVAAGSGGLDAPLFLALMPESDDVQLWPAGPGAAGESNYFSLTGARPGGLVSLRFGTTPGTSALAACPGVFLDLSPSRPLGHAVADEAGSAFFLRDVPASLAGHTILFQAVDRARCDTSPVSPTTFR